MECLTIETHVIRRRTAGLTLHPVATTRRQERIAVNRFYERYGSTNVLSYHMLPAQLKYGQCLHCLKQKACASRGGAMSNWLPTICF